MNAPASRDQLFAADAARDQRICGVSLAEPGPTHFAALGAHDPTPTPYFILEELFSYLDFANDSHLLDVGCGTGRVLAYFAETGLAGRVTGIELDPEIARFTQSWAEPFSNISVMQASALDIPLEPYTHFYLFNPFDTNVLVQFLTKIEAEFAGTCRSITLVHMSDNGETYFYVGRAGWSLIEQGEFQKHPSPKGRAFAVYEHPQHYSIWRYQAE